MADWPGQIQAAMQQLIAAREDLMIDEATVSRPADPGQTPDLDPDTGQPTTAAAATVYTGMPCVISDPSTGLKGRTGTVIDQAAVPNARIVKTPHGYDLRPGDLVTVTAAAISPSLVGDVLVIVGEEERTYATYRRYIARGSSWLSS